MRYEIILSPEAIQDLKSLNARTRAEVRDGIEKHLRHGPRKTTKSRIKRLRGVSRPEFRLRVGEVRVFYDVSGRKVQVLAIVEKAEASAWLKRIGGQ
ncbi:MAG: type II toxin-antitoxin system RelE/ParE family toxin [Candidatus Eisenbacteria bacterium]